MTTRIPIAGRVALLLLMTVAAPSRAQQAKGDRVAGRVVSVVDGHPLQHASVVLQDSQSSRTFGTVAADEQGQFSFEGVPAGKYNLHGVAPGFFSSSYHQHDSYWTGIVTGAGLPTDSLVLQLTPLGAISGHVRDEAGDPVQHAQLTLFRENPAGGPHPIAHYRSGTTDDEGNFEFGRLLPGRYYLSVSGNPWYAMHPRNDEPAGTNGYRTSVDPALDVAYPLTFYPHATDSSAASVLEVHAGEQVIADMQLAPEHAVTISIHMPAGNQQGAFPRLTRDVFGVPENPGSYQAEVRDGVMSLAGLAPGEYDVQMFSSTSHVPVQSNHVNLFTGTATLEMSSQQPQVALVKISVHGANDEALPPAMHLFLRSPGSAFENLEANLADKESAEIPNVPPGDYRPDFYGGGGLSIVSCTVNGQRTPDKQLHVKDPGNISLDLMVTTKTVTIQGIARRNDGPAEGSMILLVPAGGDSSEDLFRRDQSNLDGSFSLPNVVPGNYLLIAIDDGWKLRWTDPAALTSYLLHAIPVSVSLTNAKEMKLPEPVQAQAR